MKSSKLTLSILASASIFFTSCSSDDDNNSGNVLESNASTYEFTRNGETTVSFSGQTTRLNQVVEIGGLIEDETITYAELESRFNTGTGFTDTSLDGTKNVRSKTANSLGLFDGGIENNSDAIKAVFNGYMESYKDDVQQAVVDATVASEGVAGIANEKRNVNDSGLEYKQAFYKGLIGALVVDQISNHYLNRLDEDDFDGTNSYRIANNDGELVDGKNYTTMEHHWDEAYGYAYGVAADTDVLLQKYINKVEADEDFAGIAETIYSAFGNGRKAVVDKDYTERDVQIDILRKEIANVVAIRAVYYLQQGKSKLDDRATAFHDLSEGYGFVYSLQFLTLDGETPIFSQATVDGYIDDLEAGNGFWDVTSETLDTISTEIAAEFDFTLEQAAE